MIFDTKGFPAPLNCLRSLLTVGWYIVSFLRENLVPGINIEQERTVSNERAERANEVLTPTSKMIPLLIVVVVTFGDEILEKHLLR